MNNSVRRRAVRFIGSLMPISLRRRAELVGWRTVCTYLFFQKILRVNSSVPWPVHWSSRVNCYDRIVQRGYWPWPGYAPGQYIQAMNGIIIGHNVRLGPGVKIMSANHNVYNYDIHDYSEPIEIGDNCWLGANSLILPGVRLGNHVVVAAGAVVTKSFSDNCVIAGVPAQVVKSLNEYGHSPQG